MNYRLPILILALSIVQPIVYGQTHPALKYIPADASMIVSFNPVKVGRKVPRETFQKSPIYTQLVKDTDLKELLADPSKSGIDFSKDLLLVFESDTAGAKNNTGIRLFGSLENESLFTSNIEKIKSSSDSFHVYGTNRILFQARGTQSVAWNNEIFVVNIALSPKAKRRIQLEIAPDTSAVVAADDSMQHKAMEYDAMLSKMIRIQRDECFELLTPLPGNALASNPHLLDILNKEGDVRMWSNGTFTGMNNKLAPLLKLSGVFKTFMGTDKTTVINFENGKIVAHNNRYLDPSMTALFSKYPDNELNLELVKRLPPGKMMAMMNFSYHPELSKELLEHTGLMAMMEQLKTKLPFDPSGYMDVFGNNMLLAVFKADQVDPADSMTQKMGGLQIACILPIADRSKFETYRMSMKKFIDSAREKMPDGGMLKTFIPAVQYNDQLLVISTSPFSARSILSNSTGTNMQADWMQEYRHNSMLMYMNLRAMVTMAISKNNSRELSEEEQMMVNLFDKMVVYGGNYEHESIGTTIEFSFGNPSENSLKQFFDLMTKAIEKTGTPNNR